MDRAQSEPAAAGVEVSSSRLSLMATTTVVKRQRFGEPLQAVVADATVDDMATLKEVKAASAKKKNAEIYARVEYAMKVRGIGTNELGRRAGQSGGQISRMGGRPQPIAYETLKALATALEVDFWWLAEGVGQLKPIGKQPETGLEGALAFSVANHQEKSQLRVAEKTTKKRR